MLQRLEIIDFSGQELGHKALVCLLLGDNLDGELHNERINHRVSNLLASARLLCKLYFGIGTMANGQPKHEPKILNLVMCFNMRRGMAVGHNRNAELRRMMRLVCSTRS